MTNYFVQKSDIAYIDALVDLAKWKSPVGEAATLTYSINSPSSRSVYDPSTSETSQMVAFRSFEQAAIPLALQEWSNVANINFVQRGELEQADIRIAKSAEVDNSGAAAWAYTPDNTDSPSGTVTLTPNANAGDIWMGIENEFRADPGDYYFQTLLHEIGHALGLKHSFEGDSVLGSQDNYQYSVMSYTDHPSGIHTQGPQGTDLLPLNSSTPMLYDIAAIQYLYGSNTSYNSGDSVYRYTDEAVLMTLWDGGGIDLLDFSALSSSVDISLQEGSYSSFGQGLTADGVAQKLTNNFAIAFNAEIENLTGSKHDDNLQGNTLNNLIVGGGGNDTIDGVSGDDVVSIGVSFKDLRIDTSEQQSITVTTKEDTLSLRNIDALAIEGGFIDLNSIKISQQRVANEDNLLEIARLYQAALDRKPDDAGFNYWIDEYERGLSLQDIAQSFVDADEFNNQFSVDTDLDFITTLYQNVLLRAPDQEGVNYWLNDISNGQRYQDVLVSFSESTENLNNTSSLDNNLKYDVGSGAWII